MTGELAGREAAWLRRQLDDAPPLSEAQRVDLVDLLSAQERARVRREHARLLADCTPREVEWLVAQHLTSPPLSEAQRVELARLQAVRQGPETATPRDQ